MLSAQNTRLPHLGADLRPAQPERYRGPVALAMGAVNLLEVMKPICGADDGSNAGPWATARAHDIDGSDRRVLRAAGAAA